MRRTLGLLITAQLGAGVLLLGLPAAEADTTPTPAATASSSTSGAPSSSATPATGSTVVSDPAKIAATTGFTLYDQAAQSDTTAPSGTFATVTGPGVPPAGSGSLRIGVGANAGTGVGLFDQSYLNYWMDPVTHAVVMFPITYQPAGLAFSFGYEAPAGGGPVQVEITLWHDGDPVVYEAALPTGPGWQQFDIASAQLVDAANPTGPAQTLTSWAAPGDSLFAVFVGIDYGTATANQVFYLDNLTYGFAVTQGASAVHPVDTYDFEPSTGSTATPTPTPTPSPSPSPSRTPTPAATHTSAHTPAPTLPGAVYVPPAATSGATTATTSTPTPTATPTTSGPTPAPASNTVAVSDSHPISTIVTTRRGGAALTLCRIALLVAGVALIVLSRRRVVRE